MGCGPWAAAVSRSFRFDLRRALPFFAQWKLAPDDHLRYPIGRPQISAAPLTPAERTDLINQVAVLPARLTADPQRVGGVQLQLPYRPGG